MDCDLRLRGKLVKHQTQNFMQTKFIKMIMIDNDCYIFFSHAEGLLVSNPRSQVQWLSALPLRYRHEP